MARDFLRTNGEKIKTARKKLRLSQQEVAHLANCSPQLISKIEKGEVDTSISTLLSIQKAVGMKQGFEEDNFFKEFSDWAKETGGQENIDWLKNQIDNFFPKFKEWRQEKEGKDTFKASDPIKKVA